MTNAEIAKKIKDAEAKLLATTVSGRAWVDGGRKPGRWKDGVALLDEAEAALEDAPPPPPPPPGLGDKLRAAFTPLPANAPVLMENRTIAGTVLMNQAGRRVRKVGVTPGSWDGFYVKANDCEIDLCTTTNLEDTSGDEVQSIYTEYDRLQVYGFVSLDQGGNSTGHGTREHVLYYQGDNHLFAAILARRFYGYMFHAFSGSGSATAVNCTGADSIARGPGVVYPDHKLVVYNAIFDNNPDKGFRDSGGDWKVHRSCVWPKPTVKLGNYIDCLFEDPLLDSRGAPQNPKCWTWADPGWVPSWDAFGQPYTRACLGAVAV